LNKEKKSLPKKLFTCETVVGKGKKGNDIKSERATKKELEK